MLTWHLRSVGAGVGGGVGQREGGGECNLLRSGDYDSEGRVPGGRDGKRAPIGRSLLLVRGTASDLTRVNAGTVP